MEPPSGFEHGTPGLGIQRLNHLAIAPFTNNVAVVSNETSHNRNVAFTNSNKLISFVQEINPAVNGCAWQFSSKYVLRLFSYYPANIKLTWNYGEALNFKGMLNCDEIKYFIEEVSTQL